MEAVFGWGFLILFLLAFILPPLARLERARVEALDRAVADARALPFEPVTERKLDNTIPSGDELYFEIPDVSLYAYRRSGRVNYARASLGGSVGPARLRVGSIAFSNPDAFTKIGRGVLLVTSHRMIFRGPSQACEWTWRTVGDVCWSEAGLIVWPRNGRPKGIRMSSPSPELFAFIDDQLAA